MPDTYKDLEYTAAQVDEAIATIGVHVANNAIHVNQTEKDTWNAKADGSALTAETSAREAADSALQTAVNGKADKTTLADVIDAGSKNVFDINATNTTTYSATYTVTNNEMTINGTGGYARIAFPITLPAGVWHFSFTATVSSGNYRVRFNTASAGAGTTIAADIDFTESGSYGQNITLNSETTFYIMFYSNSTSTTGATTAKYASAMLCMKTFYDTDTSYQPYAPTNRGLYESKYDIASHNQFVGIGVQLESGADLDSIDTPGTYQITTTTIASSINNLPSECKVAGSFEVKKSNGSAVVQQYFPNWASPGSQVGAYYIRQRTGASSWTVWYKYQGTAVAAASLQSLSPAGLNEDDLRSEPNEDEQEVR